MAIGVKKTSKYVCCLVECLFTAEIVVWGHNFKKGDVVVLEVINGGDALKVGIVKMFLVKGGNVYFAVRVYVSRKTELGFFVTMNVSAETKFAAKLADTTPTP